MKRPRFVPPETIRLQGLASDPERSAWVSANAGSGKTHVLSQRVVRLLLDGKRGFVSRLIPERERDYGGEYDHLARVAEWSSADAGGEEGEDA